MPLNKETKPNQTKPNLKTSYSKLKILNIQNLKKKNKFGNERMSFDIVINLCGFLVTEQYW